MPAYPWFISNGDTVRRCDGRGPATLPVASLTIGPASAKSSPVSSPRSVPLDYASFAAASQRQAPPCCPPCLCKFHVSVTEQRDRGWLDLGPDHSRVNAMIDAARSAIQNSYAFGTRYVLISKPERIGRALDRLRAYSKHLTAASWKLWYRLASTVVTLLNDVSINMACNWILNPLFQVSIAPSVVFLHKYSSMRSQKGCSAAHPHRIYLLERFSMERLPRDLCPIHRQRVGYVCQH